MFPHFWHWFTYKLRRNATVRFLTKYFRKEQEKTKFSIFLSCKKIYIDLRKKNPKKNHYKLANDIQRFKIFDKICSMFQIDHSACNQHLTTTQLYIKNEYILYINEITCNLYFQQSIYRKQQKQQCSNSKFSIRTFRTGNPWVTNWYFMFSNNFHVQDYRYHTTEF